LKGKALLTVEETDHSLIFRVSAETYSKQLIKLGHDYKELEGKDMDLEKLLVLDTITRKTKASINDLMGNPHISKPQVQRILKELQEIEFIESTGRTSALKYIIHKSKLISSKEERTYVLSKQQSKQKQIEVILRYLDEFGEIDNKKGREILMLPDSKIYAVSRLFKTMQEKKLIRVARVGKGKTYYSKT